MPKEQSSNSKKIDVEKAAVEMVLLILLVFLNWLAINGIPLLTDEEEYPWVMLCCTSFMAIDLYIAGIAMVRISSYFTTSESADSKPSYEQILQFLMDCENDALTPLVQDEILRILRSWGNTSAHYPPVLEEMKNINVTLDKEQTPTQLEIDFFRKWAHLAGFTISDHTVYVLIPQWEVIKGQFTLIGHQTTSIDLNSGVAGTLLVKNKTLAIIRQISIENPKLNC